LAEEGTHGSTWDVSGGLVVQLQHEPVVLKLGTWIAFLSGFECLKIKAANPFQVRNGDPQDSFGFKHAEALVTQKGSFLLGQVFQEVRVVHHIVCVVRKWNTTTEVMDENLVIRGSKVNVGPARTTIET
jgi:hypothetical protein